MILDHTYFQGELHLPGLKALSSTVGVASRIQTASENSIDWFIAKYEAEFLEKFLGSSLYCKFKETLNSEDEIWKDLRNALYWESGGFKFSPVANYVYFKVRQNTRTKTGQQGEVIAQETYAVTAEDADKMVDAWNNMCDMIQRFRCEFLSKNWDKYKEFADCYPPLCWAQKINKFGI